MKINFYEPSRHSYKSNCKLPEKDKGLGKGEKTLYTSSAVLATASKPMNAKKTVADPASIPLTPKGKYLSSQRYPINFKENHLTSVI